MSTRSASLTERQAWKALATHYEKVRELHLRQLFADDPTRGERLRAENNLIRRYGKLQEGL